MYLSKLYNGGREGRERERERERVSVMCFLIFVYIYNEPRNDCKLVYKG